MEKNNKTPANPASAVDALLESEKEICGLTVYPITIARYALLELAESPLIDRDAKFTTLNVIPTYYIMTSDVKTLSKYNSKNVDQLKADAMVWSESNLDVQAVPRLTQEIIAKLGEINRVAPDPVEDSSKKAEG